MKGVKVKVKLDDGNALGFGLIIRHCGKVQPIEYNQMEPGNWWECVDCGQPILLVTETGWYEVRNKIVTH